MFETQIEDKGARRRWLLTVPIAVAIHVLALGAAVFAQLWKVESLPDPMIMEPLRRELEIPIQFGTEDGDGSAKKPAAPAPPAPAPAPRDARPDLESLAPEAPDLPAAPDPGPSDAAASGSEETGEPTGSGPAGDPNGVAGGSPLGVGDGIPGGNGNGAGGVEIVHTVGGAISAPRLLMRVDPVYCDICRRLRIEGRVMIEAVIDASGRVRDARVLGAADERLVPASLAAVRQWQYEPARLQGRPVPVYLTVTILFTLK